MHPGSIICTVGTCNAELPWSHSPENFTELWGGKRKRGEDDGSLVQPERPFLALRRDWTDATVVTGQRDAWTSAAGPVVGMPVALTSGPSKPMDGAKPGRIRTRPGKATNSQEVFRDLRDNFKNTPSVNFTASYEIPEDPSITDRDRVQMTVHEIWKVTGYRFTVKDHPQIKMGHKTRLKCSQDRTKKRGSRRQQDSAATLYNCRSALTVSCVIPHDTPQRRLITIRLHHYEKHKPYVVESFFGIPLLPTYEEPEDDSGREGDSDEEVHDGGEGSVDKIKNWRVGTGRTFEERFREHIQTLRDFCDGLEYQVQFNDLRMLETLEREGGSFLRFAKDCLTQERAAVRASDAPSLVLQGPVTDGIPPPTDDLYS